MATPPFPFLSSLQTTTSIYRPHATTAMDLLPPYHGYVFQDKNIKDGILRPHDLHTEVDFLCHAEEGIRRDMKALNNVKEDEQQGFIAAKERTIREGEGEKSSSVPLEGKEEGKETPQTIPSGIAASSCGLLPAHRPSSQTRTVQNGSAKGHAAYESTKDDSAFVPLPSPRVALTISSSLIMPCNTTPLSRRGANLSTEEDDKTSVLPWFVDCGTSQHDNKDVHSTAPFMSTPLTRCELPREVAAQANNMDAIHRVPGSLHLMKGKEDVERRVPQTPSDTVRLGYATDDTSLFPLSKLGDDPDGDLPSETPQPPSSSSLLLPAPSVIVASSPPGPSLAWNGPSRMPRPTWLLGSLSTFRPSYKKHEAALTFYRRQRRYPGENGYSAKKETHASHFSHSMQPTPTSGVGEGPPSSHVENKLDGHSSTRLPGAKAREWPAERKKRASLSPSDQGYGETPTLTCSARVPTRDGEPVEDGDDTPPIGPQGGGTSASPAIRPLTRPPSPASLGCSTPCPLHVVSPSPPLPSKRNTSSLTTSLSSSPCNRARVGPSPRMRTSLSTLPTVETSPRRTPQWSRVGDMLTEAVGKLHSSEAFLQQYLHSPHAATLGSCGAQAAPRLLASCTAVSSPSSECSEEEQGDVEKAKQREKERKLSEEEERTRERVISITEKKISAALVPWWTAAAVTSTVPLSPSSLPPQITLSMNAGMAPRARYRTQGNAEEEEDLHDSSLHPTAGRVPHRNVSAKEDAQINVEKGDVVQRGIGQNDPSWELPMKVSSLSSSPLPQQEGTKTEGCSHWGNIVQRGKAGEQNGGRGHSRCHEETLRRKHQTDGVKRIPKEQDTAQDQNVSAIQALFRQRREGVSKHNISEEKGTVVPSAKKGANTECDVANEQPSSSGRGTSPAVTAVNASAAKERERKPMKHHKEEEEERHTEKEGWDSLLHNADRTLEMQGVIPTVEKVPSPTVCGLTSPSSTAPCMDGVPIPTHWSPSASSMFEEVVRGMPRLPLFSAPEEKSAAYYFQLLAQAKFPKSKEDYRMILWKEEGAHRPWLEGRPSAVMLPPSSSLPGRTLSPVPVMQKQALRSGESAARVVLPTLTRPPSEEPAGHLQPSPSFSTSTMAAATSSAVFPSSCDPREPDIPLWIRSSHTATPDSVAPLAVPAPSSFPPTASMTPLRWVVYEETYNRHVLIREEEEHNPIPYYGSFRAAPGGPEALEERLRRPILLNSLEVLHTALDSSVHKAIEDILRAPLPATVTSLDGSLVVPTGATTTTRKECGAAAAPSPAQESCRSPTPSRQAPAYVLKKERQDTGTPETEEGSVGWTSGSDGSAVPRYCKQGALSPSLPYSSSYSSFFTQGETSSLTKSDEGLDCSVTQAPISMEQTEEEKTKEGQERQPLLAVARQGRRSPAAEKKLLEANIQKALEEKHHIWNQYNKYHGHLTARLHLVKEEKKARVEVLAQFISCNYPRPCRCLLWDMEILEESAVELPPAIPPSCVFASMVLSFGHHRMQETLVRQRQRVLDTLHKKMSLEFIAFSTRELFVKDEQRQWEKMCLYQDFCMHLASRRDIAGHEWCTRKALPSLWNGEMTPKRFETEKEGIQEEEEGKQEKHNMSIVKHYEDGEKAEEGHPEESGVGMASLTGPPTEEENGAVSSCAGAGSCDAPSGASSSSSSLSPSPSLLLASAPRTIAPLSVLSPSPPQRGAVEDSCDRSAPMARQRRYEHAVLRYCRLHTVGPTDSPFCSYLRFMEVVITSVLEQEGRESIERKEAETVSSMQQEFCVSIACTSFISKERMTRIEMQAEELERREELMRQYLTLVSFTFLRDLHAIEKESRKTLIRTLLYEMHFTAEKVCRRMAGDLFHEYINECRTQQVEWWELRRRHMSNEEVASLVSRWGIEGPLEHLQEKEIRLRLRIVGEEAEKWKNDLEVFMLTQTEYFLPRDRDIQRQEGRARRLLEMEAEEDVARVRILEAYRKHFDLMFTPAKGGIHSKKGNSKAPKFGSSSSFNPFASISASHDSSNAPEFSSWVREAKAASSSSSLSTSSPITHVSGHSVTTPIQDMDPQDSPTSPFSDTSNNLIHHIFADLNAFITLEEVVDIFS